MRTLKRSEKSGKSGKSGRKRFGLISALLLSLSLSLSLAMASGAVVFAEELPISLTLDGQPIYSDAAPVISNGRTLIPARALFEAMGAAVEWDPVAEMVNITRGDRLIQLTAGINTAFVDGTPMTMDTKVQILGGRTYIPLRFAGEALGCGVNWEEASRTVSVTSPAPEAALNVTGINVADTGSAWRMNVQTDGVIRNYQAQAVENPDRFQVKLNHSQIPAGTISAVGDGLVLGTVSAAAQADGSVLVETALVQRCVGKVSLSKDRTAVIVEFSKTPYLGAANGNLPALDWKAAGKLVVIDPGHGGSDSGAVGKAGGTSLYEKNLNLDIAARLNTYLQGVGANTLMTRTGDTTASKYGRPAMANAAQASLYVSVHNNSSTSSSPNGTEVLYYAKSWEKGQSCSSVQLAQNVLNEVTGALGLKNLGIRSTPEMAFLNKSQMPAIIIEGAFLSNPADLAVMMTDAYRDQYARGAASGIIRTLNESVGVGAQ